MEIIEKDPGYRLMLELDFNDMIPFVLANIRKRSILSFLYITVNTGLLIAAIYTLIIGLVESQLTWGGIARQSIWGLFAGSILVIPIHELLHGMVYMLLGAKRVQFGADFQQFIFFATADRYPVSGNELYLLAMAPFVVINLAIALIFIAWLPRVDLFPLVFLLCHNIMCIGDFAVANYVLCARKKVLSYDVTGDRKSYFYEKVNDGEN